MLPGKEQIQQILSKPQAGSEVKALSSTPQNLGISGDADMRKEHVYATHQNLILRQTVHTQKTGVLQIVKSPT